MTKKSALTFAVAAVLATGITAGAEQAQQQGQGAEGMNPGGKQPGTTQGMNDDSSGTPSSTGARKDPAGAYMQMHEARGTIKTLDREGGKVTVDLAAGGEVKLVLPSAALQRFKPGDKVTVVSQLAIAESGHGATPGKAPPPRDPGTTTTP